MTETVIYRGPSGTTIDASALDAVLAKQEMRLDFHRERRNLRRLTLPGRGDPIAVLCLREVLSSSLGL